MRKLGIWFLGAMGCLLASNILFAQNPFTGQDIRLTIDQSNANPSNIIGEIDSISEEISSILGSSPSDANHDYAVIKGNTLSGIARKFLGDASRWRDLVDWNIDRYPSLMKNPDLILIGWNLRLSPPSNKLAGKSPSNEQIADNPIISEPNKGMDNNNNKDLINDPQTVTNDPVSQTGPIITPDSRVLHIGDSHTCGIYGKAIDSLMRGTGAKINTYGVSGSSPSWWLNGTVGKSGYFAKDQNGKVDQPADWRTPRQTPNLNNLISKIKPSVIVFSLGANMIHASAESIQSQVRTVCEIAKKAGCKIVWIGPPNGRADKKPEAVQNKLYDNLKTVAEKYGTFIDSRPYTRYPDSGGDGVHYWGNEGSKVAKQWAGEVFKEVQRP